MDSKSWGTWIQTYHCIAGTASPRPARWPFSRAIPLTESANDLSVLLARADCEWCNSYWLGQNPEAPARLRWSQILPQRPKAPSTPLSSFSSDLPWLSQLNREGCQLVSSTPDRFVISGEKRIKKRLVRAGRGAVCCCLPFFNNFECIPGHWHFHIMAKYLLYQTTGYFRLTRFPPWRSRALWNWLSPQRLQGRPLRGIENSRIRWTNTGERQRTPGWVWASLTLNWKG